MRWWLLACAALLACGRGPASSARRAAGAGEVAPAGAPRPAFLLRVPADTPYAFAALAPMPVAYFDREYLSRVTAYQPLAEALAELRRARPDRFARLPASLRLTAALVAELGARRPADALAAAGLDRSPRWILYGAGASPVVRLELRDPARAAAALDRVLAWLAPVERRTAGGLACHLVADGDRRWLFAIDGAELVVAILPQAGLDRALSAALPGRAPAASLASERTLDQVAGRIGAAPYSVGYLDTVRLASHLALTMPAACRGELAGLAALAPRVAFGVRAASKRQVQMVSLVELRRDVAAAIDSLRGQLPGPEPTTQASASLAVGLAIDVARAATVLDGAFDAVVARPYACPALDWLNQLAREQGGNLGWIAASPFGKVDGITALVFASDAPDAGGVRPPAGGVVLLGAEQPAALLQAIAGVLPIGLPTTLAPGDKPVVVGGGIGLPLSPIHVALGQRALGFAAGGHEAELIELLAASPPADPPLLHLALQLGETSSLLGLGRQPAPQPALAEIDSQLAARLAELDARAARRYEELEIQATPGPRGLEIRVAGRYPILRR